MNYFRIRAPYSDSPDPTRRVPALEQALTNARAHEPRLSRVRADLEADLKREEATVADTRVDTVEQQERRRDLREAIRYIDQGVPTNVGVLPALSPFVGTPGLVETRQEIAQLQEELQVWTLLRDDHTSRPYRLREGMRHVVNGRRVLPGEVVYLSPTGVRAFADKFEPVDDVSATT